MHHFISPLGQYNCALCVTSRLSGELTKHHIVTYYILHYNPASYTTPEVIRFAPSSIDGTICVAFVAVLHSPTGNLLVAEILLCAAIAQNRTSQKRVDKKSNRMANLSWGFHYIAHQKRKIIQRRSLRMRDCVMHRDNITLNNNHKKLAESIEEQCKRRKKKMCAQQLDEYHKA